MTQFEKEMEEEEKRYKEYDNINPTEDDLDDNYIGNGEYLLYPDHKQYTDIKKIKDYELTSSLAFEMAIRNKDVLKILFDMSPDNENKIIPRFDYIHALDEEDATKEHYINMQKQLDILRDKYYIGVTEELLDLLAYYNFSPFYKKTEDKVLRTYNFDSYEHNNLFQYNHQKKEMICASSTKNGFSIETTTQDTPSNIKEYLDYNYCSTDINILNDVTEFNQTIEQNFSINH